MCEFGMYKCGHCQKDVMETHIVCDYARAKNWWCEKQFAKCPHRERWYPKPWFPGCAACIEKKEEQRKNQRQSRATLNGFIPGHADRSGENDDEPEDEMGWCSDFGPAVEGTKELSLSLRPHLSQSLRDRSDSVRTARTTWSGVQTAARAGEPAPRLWPAEDALKDARAGVPKPRKKKWYKPIL